MALSSTSNTMWCRPVPSDVSPMYIPGRLRTASRPFRTLMLSESYSPLSSLFAAAVCALGCRLMTELQIAQIRIGMTTYL